MTSLQQVFSTELGFQQLYDAGFLVLDSRYIITVVCILFCRWRLSGLIPHLHSALGGNVNWAGRKESWKKICTLTHNMA